MDADNGCYVELDRDSCSPKPVIGKIKFSDKSINSKSKCPIPESSKLPLVSIITVVFNGARYIEQTIEAVLCQTYNNVEYIVIDGGSSDGTVDILRKYEGYIDYWVSEPDAGIYDAMNKGVSLASGQIVGIINADDYYEKDACLNVVQQFIADPQVDLVHGAMRVLNSKGCLETIYGSKQGLSDLLVAPFSHPTCFVSREFYKSYGRFDTSFSTAADYDLMLRFKRLGLKPQYIDTTLANFRRVGVTSQTKLFPGSQIWRLMRKNKYSLYECSYAIGFRLARLILSECLSILRLGNVKKKIRKYISYHK